MKTVEYQRLTWFLIGSLVTSAFILFILCVFPSFYQYPDHALDSVHLDYTPPPD